MLSEAARGDITGRTLAPAVAAAPPVWDLGAEAPVVVEEVSVVEAAVGAADKGLSLGTSRRSTV